MLRPANGPERRAQGWNNAGYQFLRGPTVKTVQTMLGHQSAATMLDTPTGRSSPWLRVLDGCFDSICEAACVLTITWIPRSSSRFRHG
jgi:hypothetical protein